MIDSMYRSRAKSGWHIIDDKMIKTDSEMEARIIARLAKDGFSHKWRRMRSGLAFGFARYTPDVELSVARDGESVRALVEFKAFSAGEFSMDDRRRMLAVAHFYYHAVPLLYIEKTNSWYLINKDKSLTHVDQPTPGLLAIDRLARPRIVITVFNRYGRSYYATPANLALKKLADGLDFGVKTLFRPAKRSRRRTKR